MKRRQPKIKKRGAVELSMTTIVVVVIGITILTLGLKWIYNIFGGLEDQRKQLIEATQQQIRDTFGKSNDPLNVLTSAVSIEQGKYYDLGVGLKNTFGEPHEFSYTIVPTDVPSSVNEAQVLSWFRWDKSTFRLNSGQIYVDTVAIDPNGAPIGIYKLRLEMRCASCGTETVNQAPLTVRIM